MSEAQYPVSELLTKAVITVLGTLTQEDSGYNTQLSAVERYIHTGNVPAHLKAVVADPYDVPAPDPETADQSDTWWRRYEILVYFMQTESSTVPYTQPMNIIAADVEKVLLGQILTSANFGGYGQRVRCAGHMATADANDVPGMLVLVDIMYRTSQWDPYTAF